MANRITESINSGFSKYLEKNGVNLDEILNESKEDKSKKQLTEARRRPRKKSVGKKKMTPADLARAIENGSIFGESYLKEANKYDSKLEKHTRNILKDYDIDDSTTNRAVIVSKRNRRGEDRGQRAFIDRRASEEGHLPYAKDSLKNRVRDYKDSIDANNNYKYNKSSNRRHLGPSLFDSLKDAGFVESLNESAIPFSDLKETVAGALENIVFKYMHETGTVVSKEDLDKAIAMFQKTFWSDPDSIQESYKKRMNENAEATRAGQQAKKEIQDQLVKKGLPKYASILNDFTVKLTDDPQVVCMLDERNNTITISSDLDINKAVSCVKHEILNAYMKRNK